jgi:uncharacterized protein
MRKIRISLGIASAATLFMLFQHSILATQNQPEQPQIILAQNQPSPVEPAPEPKAATAGSSVEVKIDKTTLDNGGIILLTGNAPAGKPVFVEIWADEKVRASRFDSEMDKDTGKRPYILYMTEQMPAFYKILVPADKQSVFTAMKLQGRNWSYSQALKELGAEAAFLELANLPIHSYQASLLGSVVGSRGELLPAMNEKENAKRAMQLVKARFRTVGAVLSPIIDVKPDGTFSAKVVFNQGAAPGKYHIRAVVDRNVTGKVLSFENRIAFPYIYMSNAGTSLNFIFPFLLSLGIAIFGVLMGAGGGFVLTPLLLTFWPLPHTVVAGTVMPTVLFSQGSGIVNYSRIKFINWKLGISIGLAMVLGGFIGPKLTEMITLDQYKFIFGWILVILAGLMLWQTTPAYLAKNSKEQAIMKEYRKKAEAAALVKA